ncbi:MULTISPECIES: hypothetical protein [Xenorhabdus]|uniref:hypothetical protein n=1 Tax=Xenorhabdus TaxID=626 RepID=UPI0006473497|nr:MULTISPECIES: hypothetical protein [Xenorhabdus]
MSTKSELLATKVDLNLKNAFMAIAQSKHRSASQILRDLIRLYVESNQVPNAETLNTFKKTDQGEDIFYAKDVNDLFKQLDI